jgi:hypothetical protein
MSLKATILPLLFASLLIQLSAGGATTEGLTAGVSTAEKSSAEANGSLKGTVKDTAGAVLQGARIVLDPTAATGISDAQGNFLIQNVRPGVYTLTISYVGFNNSVSSIVVRAGHVTPLEATLAVAATNQQFVVMAELEGDAASVNEQRVSENIFER